MTARVEQAVAVLRAVAGRTDPTAPLPLAAIARPAGIGLSTASRLCAELADAGLLRRADGYGTYGVGARAVALSGRAAAALGPTVHFELHRLAQDTAETVVLAAPEAGGARIVATVASGWTLHVPALIGDRVDDTRRALVRAASPDGAGEVVVESQTGRAVEIAVALTAPDGRRVAVLAVSLPVYRAARARPRIRRLLTDARHAFERALARMHRPTPARAAPAARADGPTAAPTRAIEAAVRMVEAIADFPRSVTAAASAAGLRLDRARRLADTLVRTGLLARDAETDVLHVDPAIHAWHRAAYAPTLALVGPARAAATAQQAGACVFVTTLTGMRSFTMVEHIEPLGEGLRMAPWLGRPHPLVGSDGGPTLAMDFDAAQLAQLFPRRHGAAEYDQFVRRVERVRADGTLTMRSIDEFGITSISAPVRDAAGLVAAAACIVGATEDVSSRLPELRAAALDLAATLSHDLGATCPRSTPTGDGVGPATIPPPR
ncbi:transcriptional regulator, IclR family [Microbacterium sp. ru370.1]|uniref:IclR family transcriptional regulator domain-containing protein n=1 Tax=unclassified Microbacterium TaxID=2609290 RepID=UPI0008807C95|nr:MULTISPECIES: helix-turn-helix domain-containing protein [unclassified Microbacterium]SDO25950.1 transcriptional regulator, IclR family [Microbacterium sp. ru370.1]SIT73982.1 transcriptional regulator, IclR family [Microbacterium sp. RU1D]